MQDRILLRGIKFHGYHGLTRMEREVGVRLAVDLELSTSLERSGRSDRFKDTIDYREIHRKVIQLGRGRSHKLLESFAFTVLTELFRDYPAEQIRIRVQKETPVLDGIVDAVGVEMTRSREQMREVVEGTEDGAVKLPVGSGGSRAPRRVRPRGTR